VRAGRFEAALLLTLIVASLMLPTLLTISLLSVSPVSASPDPDEIVVRAKGTAMNINQAGPSPWFEYKVGDRPVNMVSKRIGTGGVFAMGASSTCRNARWNATTNPGGFAELLDVAFQWMVPGATEVLWYEGHNVYNNAMQCSDLIAELGILGYTVTPDSTQPITSALLAPYDIFIAPQMQEGTSGTGGDPTKIADAEVTAIRNFVEGGGGLVIMEASDFMGYNYNKVQNKVLAGLGLEYYFQDDQISDDTNNWGNAVYQIIADVDTTTGIGSLYFASTGKTTVGLYSTCSLAKAGPGVSMYVLPDYQVGMPGITLEYRVTVSNPENPYAENLTYNLSLEESADWSPSISPTSLYVPVGGSKDATLSVTIPANTPLSNEDTIVVTAVASGYPDVRTSFTTVAHAGLRIEPTDDTYVSTAENNTNYNDENALRIGRYYDFWQWPYLQFDLSDIPAGTDITEARLYLYCYYKYAGGFNILCHEVEDDDWIEITVTWNTKPTYGALLDTKFVDAGSYDSPKSYSWDVTSFVSDEFAGDKRASFCLRPPDNLPPSISRAFWARERYETRTHPFLMITYPTEVPEYKVSVSISPSSKSGSPGDAVTFTATVTNTGTLGDSYSLTATDTADWSPSISPQTLTLAAGVSSTATVTVTIPSGAADGATDTITVTATSQENAQVRDTDTCTAIAGAVGEVEVKVDKTSKEGKLGGKVTYTVTVTNKGTGTDTFTLQATDTAGWSPTISPSTLTLNAEASGTATVTVTIPSGAAVGASTTITVRASGTGYDDSTTCTALVKEEEGLPMILIAIVVVVVVVVVVVALMLSRGRGAAPTWGG